MFQKFTGDDRLYKVAKKNIGDKKHTVFCMNTKNSLQCSFSKRIDHFKNSLKKGELHVCNFTEKRKEELGITKYLEKLKNDQNECLEPHFLLDTLVKTTGQLNLSIEAGRSGPMYNLIQVAAAFGASIALRGTETTFEEFFPQPSKTEFRKRFIDIANEIWRTNIKRFTKLRYCCIAVDAGTTRRTSYLDFVLHHPISGSCYIFDTIVLEGTGTTANYRKALSDGILKIARAKCHPSVIVVDGQSSQNKALKKNDPESIYFLKPEPNPSEHTKRCFDTLHHIIKIPCLCHRLSNAYKRAVSDNATLSALLSRFRSAADFIKSSHDIGFSTPTFITTRWLYDFDILEFFRDKKQDVNQALIRNMITAFDDADFDLVYRTIEVARCLVNIMSDPATRLSSAFPIIENATETLQMIANNSTGLKKAFALRVKKEILSYTINSCDGGLLVLSYSLTPSGFNDICLRRQGEKVYHSTIDDFKIEKKKDIKKTDDNIEFGINEVEELFYGPEKEIDDVPTSEYNELYDKAIQSLREIGEVLDYKKPEISQIISAYDLYINGYENNLVANDRLNIFNWTSLLGNDDFKNLADIALRLEPAICSEASAERAISAQRLIMEAKRDRSKKDLNDARLTFMRSTDQ